MDRTWSDLTESEDMVHMKNAPEHSANTMHATQKKNRFSGPNIIKWSIFLAFILYALLSHYRAPIFSYLGNYLVVAHSLDKADAIVCMQGEPVERCLQAVDLYKEGFSQLIFVAREELPDGIDILEHRGASYPESRDLMIDILEDLGVPKSSCVTSHNTVGSTFEEASDINGFVHERGIRSLIVVTSPYHCRRTWLTFKKVFEGKDVRLMMAPTSYSGFRSDNWWKTRKYRKYVFLEYLKLLYYHMKYF